MQLYYSDKFGMAETVDPAHEIGEYVIITEISCYP